MTVITLDYKSVARSPIIVVDSTEGTGKPPSAGAQNMHY